MICICLRSWRISLNGSPVISWPSNLTLPDVGSMSRRMQRPVVVLPQPLSPTSPSTSPWLTENEMPSTARTCPTVRENSPFLIGKYFLRSVTSRMVVMMGRRIQQDPAYVRSDGGRVLLDPPGAALDPVSPRQLRESANSATDDRQRSVSTAD